MTLQLEFSRDELLADDDIAEPLRVGDLVCHGGFRSDGTYVSPRTRNRLPAIQAWQANHRALFGTEILDAPIDTWPDHYPNLTQARFLLEERVPDPIIATLTRIGTVEGFGAMIRWLAPADMQPFFADDITGTATAHLGRGLVEAHARDEAGYKDQAGHDSMWYAVRDLAFENPVTVDQTALILQRLGILSGGGAADAAASAGRFLAKRTFADLDLGLELLIATMLRVLFVEIKAFHVFRWAEELLSDRDLVAGDGAAATLVSYIRADETPHVDYLRTALTEMRDRTFVGESGTPYAGHQVIGTLWDKALDDSLGILEEQTRTALAGEVALALDRHPRGADLLAEFHRLGEWRPPEQAA